MPKIDTETVHDSAGIADQQKQYAYDDAAVTHKSTDDMDYSTLDPPQWDFEAKQLLDIDESFLTTSDARSLNEDKDNFSGQMFGISFHLLDQSNFAATNQKFTSSTETSRSLFPDPVPLTQNKNRFKNNGKGKGSVFNRLGGYQK